MGAVCGRACGRQETLCIAHVKRLREDKIDSFSTQASTVDVKLMASSFDISEEDTDAEWIEETSPPEEIRVDVSPPELPVVEARAGTGTNSDIVLEVAQSDIDAEPAEEVKWDEMFVDSLGRELHAGHELALLGYDSVATAVACLNVALSYGSDDMMVCIVYCAPVDHFFLLHRSDVSIEEAYHVLQGCEVIVPPLKRKSAFRRFCSE